MPYAKKRKFYNREFSVKAKDITRALKKLMLEKHNIEFYTNDLELIYKEIFFLIKQEILKGKRVLVPDFGTFNLKYCRGRSYSSKIKENMGNKLTYDKTGTPPKFRASFKFNYKFTALARSIPPNTFPYIKEATEPRYSTPVNNRENDLNPTN